VIETAMTEDLLHHFLAVPTAVMAVTAVRQVLPSFVVRGVIATPGISELFLNFSVTSQEFFLTRWGVDLERLRDAGLNVSGGDPSVASGL
jgi:hypothetical protein